MKNITSIIVAVCIALSVGSVVYAAGGVRFTKHNMSNNNNAGTGLTQGQRRFFSLNQDQVCIFCHTPHNAQPAIPLWNKVLTTETFKFYSSGTLSSTAKAATLPAGSASLLCLSCHDGKTAINVLHNASNTATTATNGIDKLVDIGGDLDNSPFGGPVLPTGGMSLGVYDGILPGGANPANIGRTAGDAYAGNNLTDDHPIGFSYTAALASSGGKLKAVAPASSLRFFAPGNRIECSTCHDPHVNYNVQGGGDTTLKPFLVMSNTGSALCLTCHNK